MASKNGNLLGLSGPTHVAFDAAFSPQVFKTATARSGEPGTRYVGLEDLYVTGGNNDNITALNVAYCWIKNVESDGNPATGRGTNGMHISLSHAYRCEIRGSYVHHARNINPGGGAYGISVGMQSSDNLIEDNICYMLNKPLVMNASGGGNVVAYNYVDEAIIASNPGWQESAVDGNHQSFSHHELFEGNWAANIGSDTTHGNAGWHHVLPQLRAGQKQLGRSHEQRSGGRHRRVQPGARRRRQRPPAAQPGRQRHAARLRLHRQRPLHGRRRGVSHRCKLDGRRLHDRATTVRP